jgi:uncharacterized membrane protein
MSKPSDLGAQAAEIAGTWGEQAPPAAPNEDEKLWGLLASVLGIFFIIGPLVAYLAKGTSNYVKFFALQTIFASLAMLVVGIALGVCFSVLAAVPMVGYLIVSVISPLFSLAWLALLIFVGLKAKSGSLYLLPALGKVARRSAYGAAAE